jgi:hypothetical protein
MQDLRVVDLTQEDRNQIIAEANEAAEEYWMHAKRSCRACCGKGYRQWFAQYNEEVYRATGVMEPVLVKTACNCVINSFERAARKPKVETRDCEVCEGKGVVREINGGVTTVKFCSVCIPAPKGRKIG